MDTHEIPMLVSSSTLAGARNKSDDGSTFTVTLDEPLIIPDDAFSCTIQCLEATIWNVIPNILTDENDAFRISDDSGGPVVNYDCVIPQGLYDLSALENAIERELVANGHPAGLFNLIPDGATQKVIIRLNNVDTWVDFTIANAMNVILGFDATTVPVGAPPGATAGQTFLAPNVAAFNITEFFLIHTDLVARGLRVNNTYSQTIATVLITVPPGSQIVSAKFHPAISQVPELIGSRRSQMRFWLTNQDKQLVNTQSEDWSARMVIKYTHRAHIQDNQ